jgi:hypothetical protein
LQKRERPSLTNGTASSTGTTQFALNKGFFINVSAPEGVKAIPPSVLKVPASWLSKLKLFIRPVLLE